MASKKTDQKKLHIVSCPSCGKPVTTKERGIWPFCSRKCSQVDLGKWFLEEFCIAGECADMNGADEEEKR